MTTWLWLPDPLTLRGKPPILSGENTCLRWGRSPTPLAFQVLTPTAGSDEDVCFCSLLKGRCQDRQELKI